MFNQSQRVFPAHTNPPTLFGGWFWLANHNALFSHVIFALDQSERFILQPTNQRPSRKPSSSCAHHYYWRYMYSCWSKQFCSEAYTIWCYVTMDPFKFVNKARTFQIQVLCHRVRNDLWQNVIIFLPFYCPFHIESYWNSYWSCITGPFPIQEIPGIFLVHYYFYS